MEIDEVRFDIMKVSMSHLVVDDVVITSGLIGLVGKLGITLTRLKCFIRAVRCLLIS